MTPSELYEMSFNDLEDKAFVIEQIRGKKNDKEWKKYCSRSLHNQLSLSETQRKKNGSKLGLKKRISEAISGGQMEIKPLGIFYL